MAIVGPMLLTLFPNRYEDSIQGENDD